MIHELSVKNWWREEEIRCSEEVILLHKQKLNTLVFTGGTPGVLKGIFIRERSSLIIVLCHYFLYLKTLYCGKVLITTFACPSFLPFKIIYSKN